LEGLPIRVPFCGVALAFKFRITSELTPVLRSLIRELGA
jgi:hypothetical protein